MHLSTAIERFIDWKTSEGFSVGTIKNNRHYLYRIVEILGDIEVSEFDSREFDRVISQEFKRGLAPGTLNNLTCAVKVFTTWAHQRGVMQPTQWPAGGRRYRSDPPKERFMMSLSTFPRLLDAAVIPRDRALIALAIYTMARKMEICELRVKDVNLESGTVYVRIFKTQTDDRMPISKELDRELRRWFTAYQQECGPLDPEWYLIPARTPTVQTPPGLNSYSLVPTRLCSTPTQILYRSLDEIGIPRTRYQDGLHMLRRSSARVLYDELVAGGYDGAMRQVQTWLHHSSIQTTERYLGLTVDRDTRDKQVRGNLMFPSLGGVVELEAYRGDRNHS